MQRSPPTYRTPPMPNKIRISKITGYVDKTPKPEKKGQLSFHSTILSAEWPTFASNRIGKIWPSFLGGFYRVGFGITHFSDQMFERTHLLDLKVLLKKKCILPTQTLARRLDSKNHGISKFLLETGDLKRTLQKTESFSPLFWVRVHSLILRAGMLIEDSAHEGL